MIVHFPDRKTPYTVPPPDIEPIDDDWVKPGFIDRNAPMKWSRIALVFAAIVVPWAVIWLAVRAVLPWFSR